MTREPHTERALNLVAAMTIEEKVGQLNLLHGLVDANPDDIRQGVVTGYLMGPPRWSEGAAFSWAREVNRWQRIAMEESRLKIPLLMARDVIHGHRTVFPVPLGQAAGFDATLVEAAAEIAAREASAQGVRWNFSPMLDVTRDPRWGRVAEGYGETTNLARRMARAMVRGYQGTDLCDPSRLAACAKHFVTYGAPRGGIDYESAELSERALQEVYLPPFQDAVEAGVSSVMPALHDLNGVPLHAHERLLRNVLRSEWGFAGLIVSDWTAIGDLLNHRVAGSEEEAVCLALRAGVQMDMIAGLYRKHIPTLLTQGRISQSLVDEAVIAVLVLKSKLGLFEQPYVDESREQRELCAVEHRAHARTLAHRAIVLLKNDRAILPLVSTYRSIAVIGPLAESRSELLGTWCLDGRAEETPSILEGIQEKLTGKPVRIIHGGTLLDAGLAHASEAECLIVVIGEHPTRSGEAASVTNLELPAGQVEFVASLARLGLPLVVIVVTGRPLVLDPLHRFADALLVVFHPGSEGGRAIADVLFGDAEPMGRLPISFPQTTGQVPLSLSGRSTGRPPRAEFRYTARYIDAPVTPLYPFGYGLSYGEVTLESLTLTPESAPLTEPRRISVTVRNSSSRPTNEIVQFFIRDEVRSVAPPLLDFLDAIPIEVPGQSERVVSYEMHPQAFRFWGQTDSWRTEPGTFAIRVQIGNGTMKETRGEAL